MLWHFFSLIVSSGQHQLAYFIHFIMIYELAMNNKQRILIVFVQQVPRKYPEHGAIAAAGALIRYLLRVKSLRNDSGCLAHPHLSPIPASTKKMSFPILREKCSNAAPVASVKCFFLEHVGYNNQCSSLPNGKLTSMWTIDDYNLVKTWGGHLWCIDWYEETTRDVIVVV